MGSLSHDYDVTLSNYVHVQLSILSHKGLETGSCIQKIKLNF